MINERTARKYCRDDISKIENYDKAIADTSQTWVIHHRLELTLDGEFALSRDQLKMHDMYYNRPYYELIFLTKSEHRRIHMMRSNHPFRGKHFSEEHCRKLGEAHKGKRRSAETRKKMSEAHRNPSAETRKKISEANKGKHHTDETRKKMSEAKKGRKFTAEHRKHMAEAQQRRREREKQIAQTN